FPCDSAGEACQVSGEWFGDVSRREEDPLLHAQPVVKPVGVNWPNSCNVRWFEKEFAGFDFGVWGGRLVHYVGVVFSLWNTECFGGTKGLRAVYRPDGAVFLCIFECEVRGSVNGVSEIQEARWCAVVLHDAEPLYCGFGRWRVRGKLVISSS